MKTLKYGVSFFFVAPQLNEIVFFNSKLKTVAGKNKKFWNL